MNNLNPNESTTRYVAPSEMNTIYKVTKTRTNKEDLPNPLVTAEYHVTDLMLAYELVGKLDPKFAMNKVEPNAIQKSEGITALYSVVSPTNWLTISIQTIPLILALADK